MVLRNEVLGENGNKVIYKTYNSETDRYGMYKECPDVVLYLFESYIHIFPFLSSSKAAAITENEEFVWISSNLEELPMEVEDRYMCEALTIQDSQCNCTQYDEYLECESYILGTISNSYRFRKVSEEPGIITYEYYTNCYTYRIKMHEGDTIASRVMDYVWDRNDVVNRLKIIIETYETQYVELEKNMYVCVMDSVCEEFATTLLTPYFVTIAIIDVVIPIEFSGKV